MTLVSPKEFKSYWDLVAPKWKGKYVSQDPLSTGLGGGLQFMYYHPELGPEFIKRLYWRHAADLGTRPPANYRLVGARKISACASGAVRRRRQKPGTAGR